MPSHFTERLHGALPDVLAQNLHHRKSSSPPCSEDNAPEKNLNKRRSINSHSSHLSPAQQLAEDTKASTPDHDLSSHPDQQQQRQLNSASNAPMAPTSAEPTGPDDAAAAAAAAAAGAPSTSKRARFEPVDTTTSTTTHRSPPQDRLSDGEGEGEEDSILRGGGAEAASQHSTAGLSSVAHEKRAHKKWLSYFGEDVDPDEELMVRYGCALSESILISGNLFISQRHICFSSNLPGLRRRRIIPLSSVTAIRKHWTLKIADNGLEVDTLEGGTSVFGSLISRDAAYDLLLRLWQEQAPQASRDFIAAEERDKMEHEHERQEAASPESPHTPKGATQCGSEPFDEVCLDIRLPTTPEKVFELLCHNDDFILGFWKESQKLTDVELGAWEEGEGDADSDGSSSSHHKKRAYSYTKPLHNAVGPRSTACKLTDEELNADPEEYFEVLTTTRTPDVPAGDLFEVQTKMAMSWAGGAKGGAKLLVTTRVQCSGKHMLKSTITKASVEGQRSYWKAMASRTRAHIKEHASEFASEDVVDAENDDELDADDDDNAAAPWYERLTSGLVDTSDPAKLVLLVLVVLLVFSNLYLLLFRGGGGSSGSRTVVPKTPVPMSAGDNAELAARVERLEMAVLAMKGALERL